MEIKKSYLYVPIFPVLQQSIFFAGGLALPVWGIAIWLLVSTLGIYKVLAPVLALLNCHVIPVVGYLDDLLLREQSEWALLDNVVLTFKCYSNSDEVQTIKTIFVIDW